MRDICRIRSYRTMSTPPLRERGFLQIVSNQLLLAHTKPRSRQTHDLIVWRLWCLLGVCASSRHIVSHVEKDIGIEGGRRGSTKADADAAARTKHALHFIVFPNIRIEYGGHYDST